MTEQRNPQDWARDLPTPTDYIAIEISAILDKFLDVPACSPEPYNRVCHDLAELFQSKLAASQLAGAVPQLREMEEVLSDTANCICEAGYSSTCPLHGNPTAIELAEVIVSSDLFASSNGRAFYKAHVAALIAKHADALIAGAYLACAELASKMGDAASKVLAKGHDNDAAAQLDTADEIRGAILDLAPARLALEEREAALSRPDVDICWEHAPNQTDKSIRCGLAVGHEGQHCYSWSTVTFFWPNAAEREAKLIADTLRAAADMALKARMKGGNALDLSDAIMSLTSAKIAAQAEERDRRAAVERLGGTK